MVSLPATGGYALEPADPIKRRGEDKLWGLECLPCFRVSFGPRWVKFVHLLVPGDRHDVPSVRADWPKAPRSVV